MRAWQSSILAGRGPSCRAVAKRREGARKPAKKTGPAAALGWWLDLPIGAAGARHRRCHRHHQGHQRLHHHHSTKERQASRGRACEHHVTEQFHSVWTHPRPFPLVARVLLLQSSPLAVAAAAGCWSATASRGAEGIRVWIRIRIRRAGSDPEPVGL
jgi:hypothetical protein